MKHPHIYSAANFLLLLPYQLMLACCLWHHHGLVGSLWGWFDQRPIPPFAEKRVFCSYIKANVNEGRDVKRQDACCFDCSKLLF